MDSLMQINSKKIFRLNFRDPVRNFIRLVRAGWKMLAQNQGTAFDCRNDA